jgi:hypothetical protein
MTAAEREFAQANEPWDGRWFVPMPQDKGLRFWPVDQFTALQLLRRRDGLTNWAAKFLQVVVAQESPLSDLQRHWLTRISRECEDREAA